MMERRGPAIEILRPSKGLDVADLKKACVRIFDEAWRIGMRNESLYVNDGSLFLSIGLIRIERGI